MCYCRVLHRDSPLANTLTHNHREGVTVLAKDSFHEILGKKFTHFNEILVVRRLVQVKCYYTIFHRILKRSSYEWNTFKDVQMPGKFIYINLSNSKIFFFQFFTQNHSAVHPAHTQAIIQCPFLPSEPCPSICTVTYFSSKFLVFQCVCVCVCAVSYTHLDVYKRQLYKNYSD